MQLAGSGGLLGTLVRPMPYDCSRDRKLAREYQGRLKFCKLNMDENRQTATKYQVMSIPTLLFFKGGKAVEQNIGAVSESVLRSKAESMLQ